MTTGNPHTRNKEIERLIFTPENIADNTLTVIEEAYHDFESGVPFFLPPIDKDTLPMRPGKLVGVLGFTSHGKSLFMKRTCRKTAEIALRIPAIARGCHETHLTRIPPKLHRKVAKNTQAKADERFISSFLWC